MVDEIEKSLSKKRQNESLTEAVNSAVSNQWFTLIARGSMVFSNMLIIWLFTSVNSTNLALVELQGQLSSLSMRVVSIEGNQKETKDNLEETREARRKDWQTVFETLAGIKVEILNMKEYASENRKILNDIANRLPQKDSELLKGSNDGTKEPTDHRSSLVPRVLATSISDSIRSNPQLYSQGKPLGRGSFRGPSGFDLRTILLIQGLIYKSGQAISRVSDRQ